MHVQICMCTCMYEHMCMSVYVHLRMHVLLAAHMWKAECAAQLTDYQYKGTGKLGNERNKSTLIIALLKLS